MSLCFPEPSTADDTIRRGEGELAFLDRSTREFAVEMRRFINGNLRLLPSLVDDALCRALHRGSLRSSFFELIVARTLQILGARELTYEGQTRAGRRPDLRGTYRDGILVVDATVPDFDADLAKDQGGYEPLIEIIEECIPPGWSFFVERLPRIGPSDSRREFKRAITTEFAKLAQVEPPPETTSPLSALSRQIVLKHPQGQIRLRLGGRPASWQHAYAGGPSSAGWGNTDARVDKALRRKRPQLRGGDAPVLVAIAGGMTETIEDFDIALFGRTFERQDERRRVVAIGFNPSGIWGTPYGGESVLAGVLAFCHWEWTRGDDPVLYLNPRFPGSLPRELEVLQRRELRDGAIASTPAKSSGYFPTLPMPPA